MTSHASRFIASAEHRIAGLDDFMITMTSCTTGETHLHEDLAMRTLVEQFGVHRVTLATNIDDGRNSRRRRTVIAMAVVAGRRRKIAFARYDLPVHAFLIFIELIRRNLVRRHILLVGMTRAASLGDASRVNRRTRIVGGPNRMRFMTAGASRNLLVLLFSQSPAMNRGIVFRSLVDAQRRIILPHKIRIRMAPATHFDNLRMCGLADVALLAVHRLQAHDVGITAVTRRATKPLRGVDVLFVLLCRLREIFDA